MNAREENLSLVLRGLIDTARTKAGKEALWRYCKIYDDLLAEVKRLRASLLTYQPPEGFEWGDEHPLHSRRMWLEALNDESSGALVGYWEWVNFQIDIEEEEE